MRIFAALVNFGIAALNAGMATNALQRGGLAWPHITAAIFCFGCGLFVSFTRG